VQNLVGIDSAVMNLYMREMSHFHVDFFVDISVTFSISSSWLQITVLGQF